MVVKRFDVGLGSVSLAFWACVDDLVRSSRYSVRRADTAVLTRATDSLGGPCDDLQQELEIVYRWHGRKAAPMLDLRSNTSKNRMDTYSPGDARIECFNCAWVRTILNWLWYARAGDTRTPGAIRRKAGMQTPRAGSPWLYLNTRSVSRAIWGWGECLVPEFRRSVRQPCRPIEVDACLSFLLH